MIHKAILKLMPAICAWLDANGIPHADVPLAQVPRIANGKITVRVNRRNGKGRFYMVGDTIASKVITVPLVVEPPAVLGPWLAGKVPTE